MTQPLLRRIALHTLLVKDLARSVRFYREALGMSLQQMPRSQDEPHALLAFGATEAAAKRQPFAGTQLHLVQPRSASRIDAAQSDLPAGYWKIGVTLPDVDAAARSLQQAGITVSQPAQFRDIGYLCHFDDPDGHNIELLQHTFESRTTASQNHEPAGEPFHASARFGQITLRIRDPQPSLHFYRDVLQMKLLSRQVVEPYRFTLYFLAYTDESPPNPDIDAVENRPWLWQRPYTTLELQHRWGSEDSPQGYRVDETTGFDSFSLAASDLEALHSRLHDADLALEPCQRFTKMFGKTALTVRDPDGYALRLLDSAQLAEQLREKKIG